jgi:tetratricopeptide (TPR) repeat protein
VNSARRETSFKELETAVNPILRTDPEVCLALADRALMEFNFEAAAKYGAMASTAAPKWPQPLLILANVSLLRAQRYPPAFGVEKATQIELFREAEDAASKSIALANEQGNKVVEAAALIVRADARLGLNNSHEASTDAEWALKLNPEDPTVMLILAQARFDTGRTDDAVSILKSAYAIAPRPDTAFFYGTALQNRGREDDLDEAIRILTAIPLSDVATELRPTTVIRALQCLVKKNEWAAAETYLNIIGEIIGQCALSMMRGYVAHYKGEIEEAQRYALDAKSGLDDTVKAETKEHLARLLMLTGNPADALPVWEQLFNQGTLADPKSLLNCAAKLRRDDVVMATCEVLQQRGVNDWDFVEFEVQYLEKYRIDAAIQRLQEFISRYPAHKLAKLRLSVIGLQFNKPDLVETDPGSLPRVTEISADYIVMAVQVLKYGGNGVEAVRYAYEFLRQHFNEVKAHQALQISLFPDAFMPDLPAKLEEVELSSAVCYQEVPEGSLTWVVLEDTTEPIAEFEEISLSLPLATELLGKKVGDVVVLAKGSVQDRTARIVEILPNYVRRYQDSLTEMQIRFGAASSVESVRVEQTEDGAANSLQVIVDSLKNQALALAEAREKYKSLPITLHMLGEAFGKDASSALVDLAITQDQQIKCCAGSIEEWNQAALTLQTTKEVIVDLSALTTLRLLRLYRILSSDKYQFIVSERTWALLQQARSEARLLKGAVAGTLIYEEGRPQMYKESDTDKGERIRKAEEFIGLLDGAVERRSSPSLASLPPAKRDFLTQAFGFYGAESILLASNPDSVLWTDDLVQARTGAKEFGTSRVWTQVLLAALTDAGTLTTDEYDDASAHLVGMQYITTRFNGNTLLAAARLALCSLDKPPLAQFIRIFSEATTDLQQLLRIFVNFIIQLYREPIVPEVRCEITTAFLRILGPREGAMVFLAGVRRASSRIFGINQIGRAQFEECFDRWLSRRDSPFIIPE